jgi:hypothetical protein
MPRWMIALLAAVVLNCGSAEAQVGGISPTTPLGMGPGGSAAVASSPDSSLPLGVTSPLGMSAGVSVGPVDIPLGATELAGPGGTSSAARTWPPAVAIGSGLGGRSSSAVSRAGIPLGATELSPGGLSPP